jgi:hypothetical protein
MNKNTGLLVAILLGCIISQNGHPQEQTEIEKGTISSNSESLAVITVVHDFFAAYDERDLTRLGNLLTPTTQIIDHNGETTNTREMLTKIEEAENWWPRKRKLWDFEYTSNGSLAVLGLKNQVNFSLPNNEEVETLYNETWILEKDGSEWKPVRIHYSKITQNK